MTNDVEALPRMLEGNCPVPGCAGIIRTRLSRKAEFPEDGLYCRRWIAQHGNSLGIVALTCTDCSSAVWVRVHGSANGRYAGHLLAVVMLTYDDEEVCLAVPDIARGLESAAASQGGPYAIGVVGQWDLFAWDIIAKAWRRLPSPRRAVIDATAAAQPTRAARDELARFLETLPPGEKASILVEKEPVASDEQDPWPCEVHTRLEAAIDDLCPTPDTCTAPIPIELWRLGSARPAG